MRERSKKERENHPAVVISADSLEFIIFCILENVHTVESIVPAPTWVREKFVHEHRETKMSSSGRSYTRPRINGSSPHSSSDRHRSRYDRNRERGSYEKRSNSSNRSYESSSRSSYDRERRKERSDSSSRRDKVNFYHFIVENISDAQNAKTHKTSMKSCPLDNRLIIV